jgi:hypothetical protein
MLKIYQIVVPLIGLIFLFVSVRQSFKGKNTVFETIFWPVFWLVAICIALFPDSTTQFLAEAFGIESNINAIIFLSLGILFFIQYHLFLTIKRQGKIITDLIRKITLQDEEKEEKDKENEG